MPINYYCSIGMVGSNIEMNKNQLLEPVIENSASQPSSPVEGQMYYDTTVGDKNSCITCATDYYKSETLGQNNRM